MEQARQWVSHQFVDCLQDAIPACVRHLIGIVSMAQKNCENGKTVTEQMGQSSLGNGHRQERTKEAEEPQGSCCSQESWENGTLRATNSRIGTNGEKQTYRPIARMSQKESARCRWSIQKEGEETVREGGLERMIRTQSGPLESARSEAEGRGCLWEFTLALPQANPTTIRDFVCSSVSKAGLAALGADLRKIIRLPDFQSWSALSPAALTTRVWSAMADSCAVCPVNRSFAIRVWPRSFAQEPPGSGGQ
jgi:hypothetical protein